MRNFSVESESPDPGILLKNRIEADSGFEIFKNIRIGTASDLYILKNIWIGADLDL